MSVSRFFPSAPVALPFQSGGAFNPSDTNTYFVGPTASGVPSTTTGVRRLYIPGGVTKITEVTGYAFHANAGVTNEAVTVKLRRNSSATSDATVGTYQHNDSALVANTYISAFRFTDLSFTVAGGDYVELVIEAPAWATNPTTVIYVGHLGGA